LTLYSDRGGPQGPFRRPLQPRLRLQVPPSGAVAALIRFGPSAARRTLARAPKLGGALAVGFGRTWMWPRTRDAESGRA